MTTTFAMTARDIVQAAMIDLGVVASGEQATAEEMADGVTRLNAMLKSPPFASLWRDTEAQVALTAGQGVVMLDSMPSRVLGVRMRQSLTAERPLYAMEQDEYADIPNKAVRGAPTSFAIFRTPFSMELRLWPVPAQPTALTIASVRIAEDVNDPTDTLDVPQMWLEAVWTNLAVRIAPMFGKVRTDPQTLQVVAQRASDLASALLDFDRPAEYHLGPDMAGYD
jgi:hypothetical protein